MVSYSFHIYCVGQCHMCCCQPRTQKLFFYLCNFMNGKQSKLIFTIIYLCKTTPLCVYKAYTTMLDLQFTISGTNMTPGVQYQNQWVTLTLNFLNPDDIHMKHVLSQFIPNDNYTLTPLSSNQSDFFLLANT